MSECVEGIVRFDSDGLVPVTVQDAISGDVLMLAFMNDEALRLTQATGFAHYWSRSRDRLWRKGETSGNVQTVAAILVNCERNSLLLQVRQTGAVCHDGYPSCYYRTVEPDGSLTVVRERWFDPTEVYGTAPAADPHHRSAELDQLAALTRLHFGAYAYLRDQDLEEASATSRRLRQPAVDVGPRLAEELRELAGVLVGQHGHVDPESDLRLEASQVIYWVLLAALREGITWARLRPDRALSTAEDHFAVETVARLLAAEADRWSDRQQADADPGARAHATLALVAQACWSGGIDPLSAVHADLAELRTRSYLEPYFIAVQGPA